MGRANEGAHDGTESREERLFSLLRSENPFTSSSVGNPWDRGYADVAAINAAASEGALGLIRQKARHPELPCAGLIFGEVGGGKTHLIRRILNHGRDAGHPFSFAYIQPIEDPERPFRYLLREITVNLCHSAGAGRTQLDIILEGVAREAAKGGAVPATPGLGSLFSRIRGDSARILKNQRPGAGFFSRAGEVFKAVAGRIAGANGPPPDDIRIDYILGRFPEIPRIFLRVLFQYAMPDRRLAATNWLMGGAMDADEARRLGAPERFGKTPAAMEQEARTILSALGLLLASFGRPLVVCFDRLENYDTDEKIRALGKMIEFLVDGAPAMPPLAFVRGEQWEARLSRRLNHQVITRLRTNEFRLRGCEASQSIEIVRSRLRAILPAPEAERLYPFDAGALAEELGRRLHSPRQVIMTANARLQRILYPDHPPARPEPAARHLAGAFAEQAAAIRSDPDRYPPDRGRLRRALARYLENPPADAGFTPLDVRAPEDPYIDFSGRLQPAGSDADATGGVCQYRIIIDVELNSSAVRAAVRRGIDFLESHPEGLVIYIRDGRCPLPPPPSWRATNEMLNRYGRMGGRTLILPEDRAAAWYALALLNYAVKEGDIAVPDAAGGTRPALESELSALIASGADRDLRVAFTSLDRTLKCNPLNPKAPQPCRTPKAASEKP